MKRVSINGKKQTKAMLIKLIDERLRELWADGHRYCIFQFYHYKYYQLLAICRCLKIEYEE